MLFFSICNRNILLTAYFVHAFMHAYSIFIYCDIYILSFKIIRTDLFH